ncbi:MAG: lytic murein transglycosylase B [Gammaproteobacteria bacterium]|jgi:membrane-bound lytic murein transglycosylase B|nr:lytic murein transglycosylase B [Gammaproteobacteria bacterium]
MKKHLLAVAAIFALSVSCSNAADKTFVDITQPNVVAFIDEMVSSQGFDRDALSGVLAKAEIKPVIIEKISTPAERKLSWGEYRKIFITKERIAAGTTFWLENREMLERIQKESGVSIEMIVGIIGVETYYGRITGRDRVLDALATLAFDYPPRSKFFRNELMQFLILAREEEIDPAVPQGSYAGAMGRPQFMPSSFRAYAVDASGDGKRDIWNNWADVAGSVANYFVEHGWRSDEEVVAQASMSSRWEGPVPEPKNKLSANGTVASLSEKGVVFATNLPADAKAELLSYEGDDGKELWVGFHNFFVITKYNRSAMYGLAAYQLGQEIASKVAADAG